MNIAITFHQIKCHNSDQLDVNSCSFDKYLFSLNAVR